MWYKSRYIIEFFNFTESSMFHIRDWYYLNITTIYYIFKNLLRVYKLLYYCMKSWVGSLFFFSLITFVKLVFLLIPCCIVINVLHRFRHKFPFNYWDSIDVIFYSFLSLDNGVKVELHELFRLVYFMFYSSFFF